MCEIFRQAALVLMKDVEVIFKAQHWRSRERTGCNDAGDNAAALLFSGKAPCHGIKADRVEPFFRVGVEIDCVASLHAFLGPLRGVADEMARIEQRNGSLGRLLVNVLGQPEIDNRTGRYPDTYFT